MEPHSHNSNSRAEALRWLGIAEKLLTTGDLVGSRTYAIRARDSDPGLEPAYKIIAVVETLIAGEKQINDQHDWYAILQLSRDTFDLGVIANHYRQFAFLLNPKDNRFPFSDRAFRLVLDAWSVLSNPAKKALYDNELNLFSKFTPNPNVNPLEFVPIHKQEPTSPPPPPLMHAPPAPPPPAAQQSQQKRTGPRKNNDENVTTTTNERNVGGERRENGTPNQVLSFWTACPYCYYMYEYPTDYVECTLRCQNCERAFEAVEIPWPPLIVDGKEAYFCCWVFYPVGYSWSNCQKNIAGGSNWNPFSQMFTCLQAGETGDVNVGAARKTNARKNTAPRVYVEDDDDAYVEVSESSESSDDDWRNTRKTKKKKNVRGKGSPTKNGKTQPAVEKGENVKVSTNENLQGARAPNAQAAESNKTAGNNAKKAGGKNAKDWGKLDLNVEFSNEVEDPTPGANEGNSANEGNRVNEGNKGGNGEEDNIEGIGIFEGLDEFLSSLPILSGVGDDKVKAT